MSTEIRPLTKKGVPFYPQTHVDAIVGNNGSGVDSAPTKDSDNLVRSGGVEAAICTKVDIKLGSNLLNVDDPNRVIGKAINTSGSLYTKEDCCVSDYIPVEAETAYHLSSKSGGLCDIYSTYGICYYNSAKEFLSGANLREQTIPGDPLSYVEVTEITTPANCAYIRTSYIPDRENLMINKGDLVPYEPYSPIAGYLNRQDVQNKDYTNVLTFLPYPARTNGGTDSSGWYSGYEVSLEGLYDAGYRTVKFRASTYLSTSVITAGVVWGTVGETTTIESTTKSKESEWTVDWFTLPITENSTKLVATYGKTDPEVGNVVHHIKFNPEVVYFRMEDNPDVYTFPYAFMPSKIYGVIGDTLQIFNRSVVAAIDPYQWYHSFTCAQGKAYSRYFEVTPQKVNGAVPTGLTIKHKLMDSNLNSSDEIVSELVIADVPSTPPSSTINVLCIGASTTEQGQWPSELKRRLTTAGGSPEGNNLENINFVGRIVRAAYPNPPADQVLYTRPVAVNVEATGGWRARNFYLGGNDPQGNWVAAPFPGNPIANPVVYPDFATYANNPNNHCNGQIDVAIFHLGVINASAWSEEALNAEINDIKFLLDGLRLYNPNCKVIISTAGGNSAYNGLEYNYGANDANRRTPILTYWIRRYGKAVNDFVNQDGYNEWCFVADTLLESDSENIFPVGQKTVNTRVRAEEKIGTNGVHPNLEGYQMYADSFYRCFVNTILNQQQQ